MSVDLEQLYISGEEAVKEIADDSVLSPAVTIEQFLRWDVEVLKKALEGRKDIETIQKLIGNVERTRDANPHLKGGYKPTSAVINKAISKLKDLFIPTVATVEQSEQKAA